MVFNWQIVDGIEQKEQQEILDLLPQIERYGKAVPLTAERILPLLERSEFQVRARTLIALYRLADGSVSPYLFDYIHRQKEECWQLWTLETISLLPIANWVEALPPFLSSGKGVFLRGVVWTLGAKGGQGALLPLGKWLETGNSRFVRDEVIAEALYLACNGQREILHNACAASDGLQRFCRYLVWPASKDKYVPKFSLYPYPDYLVQQAKRHGVTAKQYKYLYYWDRDKKNNLSDGFGC